MASIIWTLVKGSPDPRAKRKASGSSGQQYSDAKRRMINPDRLEDCAAIARVSALHHGSNRIGLARRQRKADLLVLRVQHHVFDAKSGQLDLATKEPRANHDHGVQPGHPGTKKIGADVQRIEAEGVLGGVVAHASLNGS